MSFRFRKSLKIAPGIRLNVGKTGIGISGGVPGLRVGINTRGKKYISGSIPGTGLSVTKIEKTKQKSTANQTLPTPTAAQTTTERIANYTPEQRRQAQATGMIVCILAVIIVAVIVWLVFL